MVWYGGGSGKGRTLFFCEEGTFELDDGALDCYLLIRKGSEGLYILADANAVDAIPLINYGARKGFRPTLVYATSSMDYESNKRLEQNLDRFFLTFIMNPWTLFELELV